MVTNFSRTTALCKMHFTSILVEPLHGTSIPVHVCVARSLGTLCNKTVVILQIMNVGPTPVTLYKGMHLATRTGERNTNHYLGPTQCV